MATGGLQNNVVSDKEDAKRKGKKTKKMIRVAGGQVRTLHLLLLLSITYSFTTFWDYQVWEDQSLLNWDSNDYRLFAGDLGNDVTDEVLIFCFLFDSYYNFSLRFCLEHLVGIQASRWQR